MEVRGLRADRRDTADLRESPALTILSRLDRAGAEVASHDPHVPRIGSGRHDRLDLQSVPLTTGARAATDAVVIVTDHRAVDYAFVVRHARLVVDTRNATRLVTEGRRRS